MTVYTKTMMDALKEVRDVQTEASMSSSQIAMLKKAYEPMRDKKISVKNANKLSALMDKFAKNKDVLLQLAKADIPFVSSAAVTKLISKHGMKGAEINKYKTEEMEFWAELDEGKEKSARQLVDPKKEVMVVKKSKVIVIDKKDEDKYLKKGWSLAEETELDEAPKYELYHKDFSSAMQHAYKMAKKLHGITIKPSEIDDKVASGPRKPSEGKTNTYRLEGDKGAIQVQVYNKGGSKPYELNFYKEEMDEPIKEYNEIGTDDYRKHTQEVTPGETLKEYPKTPSGRARKDAHRHGAMRKSAEIDPADVDTDASDDDVKGAAKNIIMQMRKVVSMRGNFDVEFLDKKKKKVPVKIAQAVQDKYNSFRKPADKEKFQAQVAKSYKDMLKVLKAGYNEEVELDEAKVLAKKGNMQVINDDGVIKLMKGSKVISSGDYDSGAGGFFMGKKQQFFDKAEDILKMKEEVELDEFELTEAVSVKDFDSIKKGDTVTIKYESAMSSGSATFNVTAKNMVGKGKKVEKVTMKSTKNPGGVKFFLYKRDNKVGFAIGDMGASVVSFKKEETILGRIDKKLKERKNG